MHPAVGCHYFPPGLRLPSQLKSVTAHWPVPNCTAWWQRHMGVNNLPKVVTWQRSGRGSNLQPLSRSKDAWFSPPHLTNASTLPSENPAIASCLEIMCAFCQHHACPWPQHILNCVTLTFEFLTQGQCLPSDVVNSSRHFSFRAWTQTLRTLLPSCLFPSYRCGIKF